MSRAVEVAAITQWCRRLHLPTVAGQCGRQAEHAAKERQSHLAYLEALLEAEVEERERNVVARRLKEARFPKVKTLEDFDFTMAPQVPASLIRTLGTGDWIGRAEPVILLGDAGTGKTHLATALAVVACRQRKRVRFTTAAELVNELMEARHQNESSRVPARWMRYEVLVVDEMAYVTMPETAGGIVVSGDRGAG